MFCAAVAPAGRRPSSASRPFRDLVVRVSDEPLLAFSLAVVRVERIVVLASTSIFGNPVLRQAADGGEPRLGHVAGVEPELLPCSCGRARHNAQVSRTPRPVLVPICSVTLRQPRGAR